MTQTNNPDCLLLLFHRWSVISCLKTHWPVQLVLSVLRTQRKLLPRTVHTCNSESRENWTTSQSHWETGYHFLICVQRKDGKPHIHLLWRHFRSTSLSFGPQFTLNINVDGFFYHLQPKIQLTSLGENVKEKNRSAWLEVEAVRHCWQKTKPKASVVMPYVFPINFHSCSIQQLYGHTENDFVFRCR